MKSSVVEQKQAWLYWVVSIFEIDVDKRPAPALALEDSALNPPS